MTTGAGTSHQDQEGRKSSGEEDLRDMQWNIGLTLACIFRSYADGG